MAEETKWFDKMANIHSFNGKWPTFAERRGGQQTLPHTMERCNDKLMIKDIVNFLLCEQKLSEKKKQPEAVEE